MHDQEDDVEDPRLRGWKELLAVTGLFFAVGLCFYGGLLATLLLYNWIING